MATAIERLAEPFGELKGSRILRDQKTKRLTCRLVSSVTLGSHGVATAKAIAAKFSAIESVTLINVNTIEVVLTSGREREHLARALVNFRAEWLRKMSKSEAARRRAAKNRANNSPYDNAATRAARRAQREEQERAERTWLPLTRR